MSLPVGFGVSSEPQQRATGTSSLSAGAPGSKGSTFRAASAALERCRRCSVAVIARFPSRPLRGLTTCRLGRRYIVQDCSFPTCAYGSADSSNPELEAAEIQCFVNECEVTICIVITGPQTDAWLHGRQRA